MNQQPIGVSDGINGGTYRTGGHYCTYTDTNNTEIARLDFAYWRLRGARATLRFAYAPPDPLRTLIIASPITMDLMQSAL
jgi:hypothetical protein